MNKKYKFFIAITLIIIVVLTSLTVGAITVSAPKPPEVKQITSQNCTTSSLTKATLVTTKKNKRNKVHKNKVKVQKVVETTTTVPKKKKKRKKKIIPSTVISTTSPIETTTTVENTKITVNNNSNIDTDLLAKLLYCEGGSMSEQGQIYVCSAILNFLDAEGVDLYTAAHNPNMFAVAGYVDSATPSDYQYNIINRVLNGERVAGVKYFQVGNYHSFGTPVCSIDNVYFSA